jgi:hypothetical protein
MEAIMRHPEIHTPGMAISAIVVFFISLWD